MSPLKETTSRLYSDPIIIDTVHVLPGESGVAKINVSRLPSNTTIEIEAQIYRSLNPGPTVLLLGGVHGDEINGIEIIRQFIEEDIAKLISGSIIAIPLFNVYGFINFSREVPDGKDINRSFPGSTAGSLAARVARMMTTKILPYVDFALDFHTGGASRYNYPQTRYSKGDLKSKEMAGLFNAPYNIEKAMIPKTFRKTARDLGIPTVVFEGGESIRLDGYAIESAISGIKKVMIGLNMFDKTTSVLPRKTVHIDKTFWLRAPVSGIFIWSKSSGHYICKGEPIGSIKDPFGSRSITVVSKISGHIIGHNNASVVNQGDALFHIGEEKK